MCVALTNMWREKLFHEMATTASVPSPQQIKISGFHLLAFDRLVPLNKAKHSTLFLQKCVHIGVLTTQFSASNKLLSVSCVN